MAKYGIPRDLAGNIVARFGKMPLSNALAKLKGLPLEVTSVRPVKEAIVTAGGVSLQEIEPATMASKKEEGLFFAGEVMDIDGPTGGYNLHAAFATARLAVSEISRRIKGVQEKRQAHVATAKKSPIIDNSPKRRYGDPRSSVWRGR